LAHKKRSIHGELNTEEKEQGKNNLTSFRKKNLLIMKPFAKVNHREGWGKDALHTKGTQSGNKSIINHTGHLIMSALTFASHYHY
jgi:hypothetical protein